MTKQNEMNLIGIFGGTFDPIHFGHLRLGLELTQQLSFDHLRLIPCKQPLLKANSQATEKQRIELLQLALHEMPRWKIDTREIDRDSPSYMVTTLESLHQEFPNNPLCLIIGVDALLGLQQWYRWRELFSLCHLIVIKRPMYVVDLADELKKEYTNRLIKDPNALTTKLAGYIYEAETTPLAISSTFIRNEIKAGRSARFLVPDSVWQYIQEHNIYR